MSHLVADVTRLPGTWLELCSPPRHREATRILCSRGTKTAAREWGGEGHRGRVPCVGLRCSRLHLQNTSSERKLLAVSKWYSQSVKLTARPQAWGPVWLHKFHAREAGWGRGLDCLLWEEPRACWRVSRTSEMAGYSKECVIQLTFIKLVLCSRYCPKCFKPF